MQATLQDLDAARAELAAERARASYRLARRLIGVLQRYPALLRIWRRITWRPRSR
jgi:hypothetical protein